MSFTGKREGPPLERVTLRVVVEVAGPNCGECPLEYGDSCLAFTDAHGHSQRERIPLWEGSAYTRDHVRHAACVAAAVPKEQS